MRIGSQTPIAADSATVISVAFSQCRLGHSRICPGVTGAISRNAITNGVDRTGYAEPSGVVRTLGSGAGGIVLAIMQNGQGILERLASSWLVSTINLARKERAGS